MTGETDTIRGILQHFAEHLPDAPAILAPGREPLNFQDLARQADYVEETLNGWGIGRGDRVAMVVPDRPEMAVAFLTVAGCATPAPLNPEYTASEFERYLSNIRATALIVAEGSDTAARPVAEGLGLTLIELAVESRSPAGVFKLSGGHRAAANQPGPAQATDIALVLPTSGTTSKPKIVPLCNARMTDMAHKNARAYNLDSSDQCVNIMPLSYHHGLNAALVLPLSAGCSVVLPPFFDADEFFGTLQAFSPTWYSAGPTHHEAIASRAAEFEDVIAGCQIRFIRSGAGRLSKEVIGALENAFNVPVIERYGMTETHGTLTSNPLPPGKRKPGTVGVPAGSEVRIVDQEGNFLAQGEAGEIVVRGPCVFGGYENDPKANEDAFFDDWFRTGDEGVFDEDGYLTLTGRIKETINRGGEKVNPSEVDLALMDHAEVLEAATFPIPHRTLGEEVAAAVVKEPGSKLTDQDLTRFLLNQLAGFKIPRRFIFVDAIPKTETGKVQRYKLAETLGVGGDTAPVRGPDPGRDASPLEARLCGIWKRILKLDHVGLNDNFFLLGGDSLQAVDLFLEIEQALRRRLPVAALFEAGTVAEMAKLIADGEAQGCMVAIQPGGSSGGARPPFFCVHGNGGDVIGFYNLAKHLGPDQPFYGIQSLGWDGKTVPFTRTADMVAHYTAEMRKVQPRGPYYLGGYSFGGRIAVYMANMLKAAGDEVALLALLDPDSHVGRTYATWGQWFERHGSPSGAKRIGEVLRFTWFRIRKAYDNFYQHLRRAVLFPIWNIYRATGRPLPRFMRDPRRANRLMRLEHRDMPSYAGDAVYFRADRTHRLTEHADVRDAWHRLIEGRLEVIQVPGYHGQIIKEPFVQTLAEELAKKIAERQDGSFIS